MKKPSLWKMLKLHPSSSARQIDTSYARLEKTNPKVRYAWRVLRDPFYRAAYEAYGENALEKAGFFDDGAPLETLPSYDKPPALLTTPVHKLNLSSGANEKQIVLLMTGALSPVHLGHLSMMNKAKEAVSARGFHVAGGYLSPGHDDYVDQKYEGTASLDTSHRIRLCQLALQESSWLMTDPWEGRFTQTAINFTDVILNLQHYLQSLVDKRIEVWYVFGSDNEGFAKVFVERGGFVCIQRGATPIQAAKDPLLQAKTMIFEKADPDTAQASSSLVRQGDLTALPLSIRSTVDQWNLYNTKSQEASKNHWYALRNDARWASFDWDIDTASFTKQLKQLIERSFQATREPDKAFEMEVNLIDIETQGQYVHDLAQKGLVLNLDAVTDAGYKIEFGRHFAPFDGQCRAIQMGPRPGKPSLDIQLQDLPAGAYTLVDDDIATGYTLQQTLKVLPERVKVEKTISLLELEREKRGGMQEHDVVDARDFLLGSKEGGLIVRLPDGHAARAPYMLPFVSLCSRMKIPPSSEWDLSVSLWQLNLETFQKSNLRVQDCDKASQALFSFLGFAADAALIDVCRHYLHHLQNLPYRQLKS